MKMFIWPNGFAKCGRERRSKRGASVGAKNVTVTKFGQQY